VSLREENCSVHLLTKCFTPICGSPKHYFNVNCIVGPPGYTNKSLEITIGAFGHGHLRSEPVAASMLCKNIVFGITPIAINTVMVLKARICFSLFGLRPKWI